MICPWCESALAIMEPCTIFWELPDGTKTIEISEIPALKCDSCGVEYLTEEQTEEIEDQLLLINTKNLRDLIRFDELMAIPRLLKRNYFK